MYKTIIVVFALATVSMAEPKPGVFAAYTAPIVAPAVVTAQSSQYFTRNFNGFVTPFVATAPIVETAPVVTPVAKAAPLEPEIDENAESIETGPISKSNKVVNAPIYYRSSPNVNVPAHLAAYYKSAPLVSAPLKSGRLVSTPVAYSTPFYKSAPLVTDAIVKAAPVVKSAPLAAAPLPYPGAYYTNAPLVAQPAVKAARLEAEPVVKAAPVVATPVVKSAPLVAAPVAYSTPYYNPYIASPYFASPYYTAQTPLYV